MNLEMFNQEKADPSKMITGIYVNKDAESECVRLSNELRNHPAFTTLTGKVIPATTDGFDIETAPFGIIRQWLHDESKKKSPSLFCFVHRILAVRFPIEYQAMKVHRNFKAEKNLIDEKKKNNVSWFGEVGYSGKVTLLKKTMRMKKINNKWTPIL
tara:strand:+ start:908 stop:1375 length:468 start_codon:yes stop_codon:yes gene_type:complete